MAVQLSPSYLRHSYQILATIKPRGEMAGEEAFQRATNIVYEWAKSKAHAVFPDLPYYKQTMDKKCDGSEIGILYDKEEEQFAFRLAHIDTGVAGRIWITDVQICRRDDQYAFATRLSVSTLQTCTEVVPFSCPQFVRYIAQTIGLADEYEIQEKAHLLDSNSKVERLIQYLTSPERSISVILVAPSYFPEEEPYDGYTVDSDRMAKDLIGVAQIFRLTSEMAQYLRERLGRWAVYDGAIRTFYPGLSLEEEEFFRHPRLRREQILMRNTEEEPDRAMQDVEEYVRRFALGRRLPWTEAHIRFYLTEYQDFLRKQRADSMQTTQDLIDSYEADLAKLDQIRKENIELADSYSKYYENEQESNRQLRQRIRQMEAHIQTLETRLQNALQPGESIASVDGTYDEIPAWIEENYPGRLFLSPRAKRSLKKAVYEDVSLVYKCLQLLATSYYAYRTGCKTYEAFTQDCFAVDPGLREAGAVTDAAAGMYGDDYRIEYNGKKRLFERHIGKGTQKDPSKTLRIYFFWDDEDEIIVIGDLPGHLDNSLS